MRPRLLIALVAAFGLTAFAPVPLPKEKKGEVKNGEGLQGLWVVKSRQRAGGRLFKALPSQQFVRIAGKTWHFGRDDGMGGFRPSGITCTIRLDLSKSPVWMDLDRVGGPGVYSAGLVEVSGDTMRFVYAPGGDRPTDFKLTGGRDILMTLERVKKP
jgi:uncharacterized protein (TIGR03067 family)